ncbi:hypothetical protein Pmar_PMAR014846, partial [Perkinsus marinus ATCC 50983]
MTIDNPNVSSIVRMLVADIMGIPDELGDARVNERFHWALSPLACKQVDFGIAEIPENSVLTSLIRTLEREVNSTGGKSLPPSLQCQTLVRQLQTNGSVLKERAAILRFLALMMGTADKENLCGNMDVLAHACTQPTPNNEGAAVKMLSGSVAARGPSNSNTSNEVISVVEIKGATESELVRDLVFVLQG